MNRQIVFCMFVYFCFGFFNLLDAIPGPNDPEYDSYKQSQPYIQTDDNPPSDVPVRFTRSSREGLLIPLDGTFSMILAGNDDGSSGVQSFPFLFNLYGIDYTTFYVNNNGNVSFGGGYGTYTPYGFPVNSYPMLAPFWADVDTRPAASGKVWIRILPHQVTVIWDHVGYYGNQIDKLNTFQVIITDGTDPTIGIGNNVAFSYGDMQWTTGSASGGSGGFGGTPATVGINKGDGVNYALIGRFNHAGNDYDGPGGNADGVSYLDDQVFHFITSVGNNIPPIFNGVPASIELLIGQSQGYTITAIGPENGQTVTSIVESDINPALTTNIVPGNPSTTTIQVTGLIDHVGTHWITITAYDNGTPVQSSQVTIPVQIINTMPTITSDPVTSVLEDQPYQYQVVIDDPDFAYGDQIYEAGFISAPAGMSYDLGTNSIIWSPQNEDVGIHSLEFWVSDLNGGIAYQSYLLEVINVNDPPQIDIPPSLNFVKGDNLELNCGPYVNDVDSNSFEISVSGNQHIQAVVTGMNILFSCDNWTGYEVITVTVSDMDTRLTASDQIGVTVLPALSCFDIQGNGLAGGASAYEGMLVSVEGVVVAERYYLGSSTSLYGFFIADNGGGPYSGLFINSISPVVHKGDRVLVRGTVSEAGDFTQVINPVNSAILSSSNDLPVAQAIQTSQLTGMDAEMWESVLVSISDVQINDNPNAEGEFWVTDGSQACQIDDQCLQRGFVWPGIEAGGHLISVRGVVDLSGGLYAINPRDISDLHQDHAISYSFISYHDSFIPLTNGTALGDNTNDNESFNAIPLGFDFIYDGVSYDQISVQSNGYIAMGSTVFNSTIPISSSTGSNNVVAALARDLKSHPNGSLSYQLLGTAPEREFVVQWSHYRRVPTAAANDDLSFQIRLMENGNSIKIVYGAVLPVSVTTAAAVQVGLRFGSVIEFFNRETSSDWTNTTQGTTNSSRCILNASVYPASGQVFLFAPLQARFSANPETGYYPLSVQFTDLSVGTVSQWEWDLDGDGSIDSYQQHPVFTYTAPGSYDVKQVVLDNLGNQSYELKRSHIVVTDPPYPDIAVTPVSISRTLAPDETSTETISISNTGFSDLIVNINLNNPVAASDLFISEYVEGSSNNKAIEIFNGTGGSVDLSTYKLKLAPNGGSWLESNTLQLSGLLANGATFVVCNQGANAAMLDVADAMSTVTYYNGDDAIGLFKTIGGVETPIDIMGVYQLDPGTAWDVAGEPQATLNHTLIRKPQVNSGTLDWAISAGTSQDNSQWDVFPNDYIDNLGWHHFAGVRDRAQVGFPFIEALRHENALNNATRNSSLYSSASGPENDDFPKQHHHEPILDKPTEITRTGERVLIIRDTTAWGYNVNQPLLEALGAVVATASSSQISTIDLSQFDMVIIESNQSTAFYQTYIDNINRFHDYVMYGGYLQVRTACQSSNRIPNLPLPGGVNTGSNLSLQVDNYVVNSLHPVVAGLPNTLTGNYASHENFLNLPANVDIITSEPGGAPTTIEYNLGYGKILATGMCWEYSYANNYSSGSMLPLVMQYTLSESQPDWLTCDLLALTVPPGETAQLTATIDSQGLTPGPYHMNINITSNDPVTPMVYIPVTLNVQEDLNPPFGVTATLVDNHAVIAWQAPAGRILQGYRVWRLPSGQEGNEAAWTLLTPTQITQTEYSDFYPMDMSISEYKWAVRAEYSYQSYSLFVLSNPLMVGFVQAQGWTHISKDIAGSKNYDLQPPPGIETFLLRGIHSLTNNVNAGEILTGDVNGDGEMEIVTVQSGYLKILTSTGNLLLDSNISVSGTNRCFVSMLEDINNDGVLDIGVGYVNSGYQNVIARIYDSQGNILKQFTRLINSDGMAYPITKTRDDNLIIAQQAGYALSPRGLSKWNPDTQLETWYYPIGPGLWGCSVADADSDGFYEMLMSTATPHNGASANGTNDGNTYDIMINEQGQNLLTRVYDLGSPDGSLEDYFVKPFPNEPYRILSIKSHDPTYYQGTSRLSLRSMDGTLLSSFNGFNNTGWSAAWADINGDGNQEIVAVNSTSSQSVLYVFNGNLSVLSSLTLSGSYSLNAIGNLFSADQKSIVVSSSGQVAVYSSNLALQWSYQVPENNCRNAIISDCNANYKAELIVLSNSKVMIFEGSDYLSPRDFIASGSGTAVNLTWNTPETGTPLGYKIWRSVLGANFSEDAWTLLTPTEVNATQFEDFFPTGIAPGLYQWAIQAVYANNNYSDYVFSNELLLPVNHPTISVSTDYLYQNLVAGGSGQQSITISNTGNSDLVFSITELTRSIRTLYPHAGLRYRNDNPLIEGEIPPKVSDVTDIQFIIPTGKRESLSSNNGVSEASSRVLDWLSESPLNGTIPPTGSAEIVVVFYGQNLNLGQYLGQLQIGSNDPINPLLYVDVTMNLFQENITTEDNENNVLSGIPDWDMDTYMSNQYENHPIEFNIFINETAITSAQLSISAWDVDYNPSDGEVDLVFLNSNLVGHLSGANDQWSTSVFELDPAWVIPGPSGKNLVQIFINTLNVPDWRTTIDWGQLVFNQSQGNATIRYVSLDEAVYAPNMPVTITQEIDTDLPTMGIKIQTNLLSPDGTIIDGSTSTYTIHGTDNDPVYVQRLVPSGADYGPYTIRTIVYNMSDVQQDIYDTPFQVIQPGPRFSFDPPALDLGTVFVTDTLSVALEISNLGYNPLDISSLTISNPAFSLSESSFIIPRLESRELLITYTPTVATTLATHLQVSSNDSVQPNYQYPVTVISPLYPVPLAGNIVPDQITHPWLNQWQVIAEVTFSDSMIVDASTLQYRFDKNGNGSYDATEIWTAVTGYEDGPVISVIQPISWRRDGDHLCFEFRAQNTRGSGWCYTGLDEAEGILDDFYVRLDATAPWWMDTFSITGSGNDFVTLNWEPSYDPHFESYEIFYASHSGVSSSDALWDLSNDPALGNIATQTSTITGLMSNTIYYFAIRGRDFVGNTGDLSDEIFIQTGAANIVQNLALTIQNGMAQLSWDTFPGANLYRVYHASWPEGPWLYLASSEIPSLIIPALDSKAFFYVTTDISPAQGLRK